jgi:hypothetical protein
MGIREDHGYGMAAREPQSISLVEQEHCVRAGEGLSGYVEKREQLAQAGQYVLRQIRPKAALDEVS